MKEGLSKSEDIIVVDDNGSVIFSSNSNLNEVIIQQQASDHPLDKRLETPDGNSYVVANSDSSIVNWHYYIANNWDDVTKETTNYSFSILLLIVVVLIIIDALIGYAIYTPINLLTKKANTKKGESIHGNELQFLANSFDDLVGNNAELAEKISEQRSRVMELFELQLLRRELLPESVDSFLEKLQIDSISNFTTIAIIFRTKDEAQTLTRDREDEIGNEIVYHMPEKLRKSLILQPVYNARAICCIIGEEDPEVMVHVVMDFFNELKKYVENTFDLQIGVGVSAIHNDIHQLNIAYQESIHALNSYMQNEEEDTHSWDYSYCRFYTEQVSNGKKVLESSYEKEIKTAIMGCDKEQAYNAINLFFQYLKQQKLSRDDTVIYLIQFTNAILLAVMEFGLDTDHLFRENLSDVYMQMIRLYDLDKCRKYLKHVVIDPMMAAMDSLNSAQTHIIMGKVQKLIEEHKGNITLTECAEALNYHPTYIWKILKMEKNKSFTNYLEEYKIEQAKYLLKETNLTITEIALQLNYTNAQNFIRFFNKMVGTSPGKYRNLL
jgi:AraC-like DNA-binding protein